VSTSYDVKFFEIYRNKSSKAPSYVVRWQVAKKRSSKTYRTKALAESFLSDLRQAAKRGEPFEIESGLPLSMLKAKSARTVFDFVRAYVEMKWPHVAAKTRDSMSDALSTVLPALTKDRPGRPDADTLRTALRKFALLPAGKRPDPPLEIIKAVRWLEAASLDLADLNETKTIRLALDAIALRLDGKAASANTIRRKRAVLHAVLEYAVELEELPANPLHRIKWKPPKTTETVDPRVVVNPRQARELLTAVTYVGKRGRGRRLMALFACMYYAALRPAEAVALRQQDCHLPATGWGRILVDVSRPEVTTRWTDTGDAHEARGSSIVAVMMCGRCPSRRSWSRSFGSTSTSTASARTGGSSGASAAGWSPQRRTRRCGRKPGSSPLPLPRSPHRWHAARTTCGTRPCPCGSTLASRLPRWPSGPGTASMSSCASTPSASTGNKRSPTGGSMTPWWPDVLAVHMGSRKPSGTLRRSGGQFRRARRAESLRRPGKTPPRSLHTYWWTGDRGRLRAAYGCACRRNRRGPEGPLSCWFAGGRSRI